MFDITPTEVLHNCRHLVSFLHNWKDSQLKDFQLKYGILNHIRTVYLF